MHTIITGVLCTLGALTTMSFTCQGPQCAALTNSPSKTITCHGFSHGISCRTAQHCPRRAEFKNVFEIEITPHEVRNWNVFHVNGTSFPDFITVPRGNQPHEKHNGGKKDQRDVDFVESIPTHLYKRADKVKAIAEAVAKAFTELPKLSEARLNALFDFSNAAVNNREKAFKDISTGLGTALDIAQSAFLPPQLDIEVRLARGDYEGAAKSATSFALEFALKAALGVGAIETGGLDLPLILGAHAFATIVTDNVFEAIDYAVEQAKKNSETAPAPATSPDEPASPAPQLPTPVPEPLVSENPPSETPIQVTISNDPSPTPLAPPPFSNSTNIIKSRLRRSHVPSRKLIWWT